VLLILVLLFILIVGAGAAAYFLFPDKIPFLNQTASPASSPMASPLGISPSLSPSSAPSPVSETGDPNFDEDLQAIDKSLDQLDQDASSAGQGLNDQQIDIMQ
jgi:hypothetical protein